MARLYYVRNEKGRVAGPFTGEMLRQYAKEGKISPSWYISVDREKWAVAARARNLFDEVDKAIDRDGPRENRYRNLTRKEQIALFVDKFVFNNEQLKDSMPWLQRARAWWAKLTLPSKGFVIAEITTSGIRHVRYDFEKEEGSEIGQKEFEQRLADGIRQTRWFTAFSVTIALIWGAWTIKDFVGTLSLTFGTLKTLLFAMLVVIGFIYKTKQSKVFIGYVLDPEAGRKLEAIRQAFLTLRKCGAVWAYRVQAHANDKLWKYNAGSEISVSKLPIALFNRPIPNVETNIQVCGATYLRIAIYFLPEKLLVIDGSSVHHVPYDRLAISHTLMEYVETEGQVFPDSVVIDHRWKYINRDGTADRRFKSNVQLPVVRCGILRLDVDEIPISLMTTNPMAPRLFCQTLPPLDGGASAKA